MEGYLGETIIEQKNSEFNNYTEKDWVIYFIESYGQYDGGHHKQWILDQISRIIKGTPIIIYEAKWSNGQSEFRIRTGEPSKEYLDWVCEMCDGEDGPETYDYDKGIAP